MSNIPIEPNIPEAESDYLSPRQLAYAHPDFGAELGSYESDGITVNDLRPGQPHEADVTERAIGATHAKGARQNPVYTLAASVESLSTFTANVVAGATPYKLLPPNPFRTKVLIQVIGGTGPVLVSGGPGVVSGGSINGLQINQNASLTLEYSGELWIACLSGTNTVAVGEFIRVQDS